MLKSNVMFSVCQRIIEVAQNCSKQLLTVGTALRVQVRNNMGDSNTIQISLQTPVSDYKKLMEDLLSRNLDDKAHQTRCKAIAAAARNIVWKLLFEKAAVENPESEKNAGELLKEYKMDACFYCPWDYNEWIIAVRDEVLKRKKLDFWCNYMVKEALGPCWARDSDYFDDMEDPTAADFYRHGDAIPPWESKQNSAKANTSTAGDNTVVPLAESAPTVTDPLPPIKISMENPVNDYTMLMKKYLTENETCNDEEAQTNYKKIADCACKIVWALLFDDPQPPSQERQNKAGELLREHKMDACFYAPWLYNEWIVKIRDEVLKRELLDFWRNHIVKHALGLCWARDSDFFDNLEDKKPAEFYKHAGCMAPWLKEEEDNQANEKKTSSP